MHLLHNGFGVGFPRGVISLQLCQCSYPLCPVIQGNSILLAAGALCSWRILDHASCLSSIDRYGSRLYTENRPFACPGSKNGIVSRLAALSINRNRDWFVDVAYCESRNGASTQQFEGHLKRSGVPDLGVSSHHRRFPSPECGCTTSRLQFLVLQYSTLVHTLD